MSRLTKVEPILDIAAWENMLVSSEEKLIGRVYFLSFTLIAFLISLL